MTLRFECRLDDLPGFRADAVLGNTVFEVLKDLRDARRLRTTLLEMARIAAGAEKRRGVLVLDNPRITESRLREEWEGAASVIRPDIFRKLSLVIRQAGQISENPPLPAREHNALEDVLSGTCPGRTVRPTRGSEAFYDVLRLLIHQWLLGRGPVAIKWLMETAGASHPTVSNALRRLDHCLTRHSDRRVELRFFPREEWVRLLAVSDKARGTARFADRSGQARSPESLLRRLQKLQRSDVAVGGIWGAKHYYPPLDIVGNPRLDLSLHCPGKTPDFSFIERLDPALAHTERRDEPASLVVHLVQRAKALFEPGEEGIQWADPVECLLDLHEARLEPQALEFLNSFHATKGGR